MPGNRDNSHQKKIAIGSAILGQLTVRAASKGTSVTAARIVSIQVGMPTVRTDDQGSWESAFVKLPVDHPVWVRHDNVDGDRQADQVAHGGPDQAVLGYAASHYPDWREQLERPELAHGAFGENLTIEGLDETSVCIGDTYRVGDVVLQVTQPRGPCWKIARRHGIPTLTKLVQESARSGWYFRVLEEGKLAPGATLDLTDRPNPNWPVTRAFKARTTSQDQSALTKLAALPELGHRWRVSIIKRLEATAL